MTNQSTVPHTEIGLRLTICSEFLRNEEKPVEELYGSWMRKMGGRLIEFTEFEYWYRRFKNNLFDLGYDTNLDSKEISEIQIILNSETDEKRDTSTMTIENEAAVKVVEKQTEDLRLDDRFYEKNVPVIFQTHNENAVFGTPSAIQIINDNGSETSNVDTSQDSKEIFEIQNTVDPEADGVEDNSAMITEKKEPVKVVKRNTQDLKFNYQFNEKDVPQIFRTVINDRLAKVYSVRLCISVHTFSLHLGEIDVRIEQKGSEWMISYKNSDEEIKTDDPEKSIIDHLWFVLKNPEIKLGGFEIRGYSHLEMKHHDPCEVDSAKLNTLLQSMFLTFDHQIDAYRLYFQTFNEDTFLSMLKHVKPKELVLIDFNILWKQKGNYQKMEEIVGTDQWKQATWIDNSGFAPLKINYLFQCTRFSWKVDRVTPEDLYRVTEHVFSSAGRKRCTLTSKNKRLNINSIINLFQSQNDGAEIIEYKSMSRIKSFCFKIVKSAKYVFLSGYKDLITIQNYSGI